VVGTTNIIKEVVGIGFLYPVEMVPMMNLVPCTGIMIISDVSSLCPFWKSLFRTKRVKMLDIEDIV